jgi:hypothetical protein
MKVSMIRVACLLLFTFLSLSAAGARAGLSIGDYEVVEFQPVSRFEYEVTFSALLTNDGEALSGAQASLTTSAANVTVIDGNLSFGETPTGQRSTSLDTFKVRIDRTRGFQESYLVWDIDATPLVLPEATFEVSASPVVLRMTEGQTEPVSVQIEVDNASSFPLDLLVEEIPSGGLGLASDNATPLQAPPGPLTLMVNQELTALLPGPQRLEVRVTLQGVAARSILIDVEVLADTDRDGVADSTDYCAGTPPDTEVDAVGCSETQEVVSGVRTIELYPPGAPTPIVFKTLEENVTDLVCGLQVDGDMTLETALGPVALLQAQLLFECGTGGPLPLIERISGFAQVPFPDVGILAGAEITQPVMAAVGLDRGENLAFLDAPLNDDRYYLYFDFFAGFEASLGPISFAAPFNRDVTFVLDPEDPFFFLRGDIPGLDLVGVSNTAIGMSVQGLIPFEPETTYAIDGLVEGFQGHLYLKGTIPFAKLPLAIDGELVTNFDPDMDGGTPFNDTLPDVQMGGNGQLDVSVDFMRFFSFGFPLGNASVGVAVTGSLQEAYLSGVLSPDVSFIPSEALNAVPILPTASMMVAGYISSDDLAASFLQAEGMLTLSASNLGNQLGVPLNDLAGLNAFLRLDREGFLLTATTAATIHPSIDFGGMAEVTAFFSGDPANWYILMLGDMDVFGVPLLSGSLDASLSGLFVEGSFVTPLSIVAMSGEISPAGANIGGRAAVTIPVSQLIEAVEIITNGAICGYDVVTDAAICGTETITDDLRCGTDLIRDSEICGTEIAYDIAACGPAFEADPQCGYEFVTDAAICGTETVTSAVDCGTRTVNETVQCGTKFVTDAAICGWEFVTGLACAALEAIGIPCQSAKTCEVPKFCDVTEIVAKSCDVPLTCEVTKSCCELAASCEVPATCEVGKTCEIDATCERSVEIENPIGNISGNVDLSIGTGGLSGNVFGQYCTTSGDCQNVSGGRLRTSPRLEACITAPGGVGEVCAPF